MRLDYEIKIKKIEEGNKDNFKKVKSYLGSLKHELSRFSFDGDFTDLSLFLVKVKDLLPKLTEIEQQLVDKEIEGLHKKVRDLITTRPDYVDKANTNFIELKAIIDNLEGLNLSYMYNYIEQYDGNAYNLVRYLLFEEKNLAFVKYALKKYPHFINARKEDSDCIISDVVDRYIEAIDKYTRDGILKFQADLFFYDQVLEELLASKKIYYSSDLQIKVLKKVTDYLRGLDQKKYNGEIKAKLVFWCNELQDKLEKLDVKETLSHLSYKTDITIDFHESVLSETRRFSPRRIKDEVDRRDKTRDEYIITIDGEKAEEIDDGLSVRKLPNGNYLLGVHITDPTGYISKNSILYDEAYRRTSSIYLPGLKGSSMFPDSYSKNYMSLMQGKNRLATSYYLEVTTDGEILLDRCEFKKTVVNVNKKMSYNSFNLLSDVGTDDKRLRETIEGLHEVCNCLSKRMIMDEKYRLANRGISNPSGTNIIGNSMGEKVVEKAMLAVNSTVASYAAKTGIPFIYRALELDQEYLNKIDYFDKKFRENPTSDNYEVFVKMLKDTYPKSFYTTDSSKGHVGNKVPHYAHLTSPLRRFADCLATEALNLFYFQDIVTDKEAYEFEDRLKEGCRYLNERKTAIDYFSKRFMKVKKR